MRELESYSGNAYPDTIVESGLRILTEFEKTGQFKLHSDPATAWLHESTPTEAIVGANTSVVDFIRIGRGSINAFYKPLAVQITLSIARLYAEREMREMGFVRSVGNNNVVFWIKEFRRTGDESPSTARPLFFFHGLGFGIVPYIHFIRTLVDDRRTMVVPEWPNISLGWKDNTRDEGLFSHHYAEALSAVVKTLKNSDGTGATTIDVIGHSYVSDLKYAALIATN